MGRRSSPSGWPSSRENPVSPRGGRRSPLAGRGRASAESHLAGWRPPSSAQRRREGPVVEGGDRGHAPEAPLGERPGVRVGDGVLRRILCLGAHVSGISRPRSCAARGPGPGRARSAPPARGRTPPCRTRPREPRPRPAGAARARSCGSGLLRPILPLRGGKRCDRSPRAPWPCRRGYPRSSHGARYSPNLVEGESCEVRA
jgi:hypothetical protein